MTSKKIVVKNLEIVIFTKNDLDYISLTDIAKYRNYSETDDIIKNWIRNRSTVEYLGLWEKLNNANFKHVEFDGFLSKSGSNSFVLSPTKWIQTTDAVGLISKSGRNGGTFAHKDIAFEFAMWLSAEFKLYLVKEFQRLKEDEQNKIQSGWNVNRILTKINYKIHTDAINKYLIPESLSKDKVNVAYATEADLLNVALFGRTAKQWRDENLKMEGNIRDYADVTQLIILANLESINAEFVRQGLSQSERLIKLNQIAIIQMKSLANNSSIKKI